MPDPTTAAAAPALPVLTHPDGREYQPSTAQEATRLVTAEGYKLPEGATLPDAFAEGRAKLAERNAREAAAAEDVDAAVAPANTNDQVGDPSGNVPPKSAPAGKNKAAPAPTNKGE